MNQIIKKLSSAFNAIDLSETVNYVNETLLVIINAVLGVVGSILVIFLIICGLKLARADDPEKRKKTLTWLMWILIGAIIIALALTFVNIFLGSLGIEGASS